MNKNLFIEAIIKFTCGVILLVLLLFLPAGTLAWSNGWLFMALLFIPMFCAGLVMMGKNPDLLESRLRAKEGRGEQQKVVRCSGLMFLLGFVTAGLDHRFDWSHLPRGVALGAAAAFLIAYLLYAEVLRENTYLSRTIEVQEGQRVIDTGLYGIVRHPMYSATLLLFLSMPLVLGSLYAFVIFLVYPFLIARRILDEEAFLAQELPGYRAYREKVRWRLLPWVW